MEITLKHAFTYTTQGDVPISVVAKSLLANERLVHESLHLLTDLVHDLEIQKVSIKIGELSNASPLKEAFIIGMFIAFQEDLEKEVPELIESLTGKTIPDSADTLITALVLIVAIHVISTTIQRVFPGKEVKELKAEYEENLKRISELTNIDRAEIDNRLKTRVTEGKTRSLLRKAHSFFLPAKIEAGVEITTRSGTVVNSKAIQEIPSDIELAIDEKQNVYQLENSLIEIHRADIDYPNQGWIAIIEEVSEKRRKLILPPNIPTTELYGKTRIIGNITVIEEKQQDGEFTTKEYHLEEIVKKLD